MELPWNSHGTPMELPGSSHGTPRELPWNYQGTPKVLQRNSQGTLRVLGGTPQDLPTLWDFQGTPRKLLRNSRGILKKFLRNPLLLGIPMRAHVKLLRNSRGTPPSKVTCPRLDLDMTLTWSIWLIMKMMKIEKANQITDRHGNKTTNLKRRLLVV